MPDIAEERVMEIWKQYLEMIIRPDHKLMLQQKRRIRYHLKNVLASVVDHATPGDLRNFWRHFWFGMTGRMAGQAGIFLCWIRCISCRLIAE